jgi:hypothetical protein
LRAHFFGSGHRWSNPGIYQSPAGYRQPTGRTAWNELSLTRRTLSNRLTQNKTLNQDISNHDILMQKVEGELSADHFVIRQRECRAAEGRTGSLIKHP